MTTSSLRRIGASILVTATAAAGYVAVPDPAGTAAPASQQQATHAVTTWGASDDVAGGTLSDVSVRNILRTSVGGKDLRIRLSNANGDQPLVLDSIYVGRQQSGAAVVPGTTRGLVAACLAPFILAWIVVRGHKLTWRPGEITMIVGMTAFALIILNGVILGRPGDPDSEIDIRYGYFVGLLGSAMICAGGIIRQAEGDRARKPPGTL